MSGDKDASELVFASLTLAERLIHIANERLTVGENVSADSSSESNQDVLTSGSLSGERHDCFIDLLRIDNPS
jgi:hypothetical protein